MLNVSICRVKEKASSLMLSGLVLFIDVNDPAGAKAAQPPGERRAAEGMGEKKPRCLTRVSCYKRTSHWRTWWVLQGSNL